MQRTPALHALYRHGRTAALLALIVLLAGSGLLGPRALAQAAPPNPAQVESLIVPYRDRMTVTMSEVLADCPVEMRARDPEGPLGNLVCDIVLERARQATGLPVDICVLNNGGLRADLGPGPVTLGLVYEIMPFDNEIVVLHLDGPRLRVLADQIAEGGGEPVAGLSLTIRDGRAIDLMVGRAGYFEPVTNREYLVATSDYLANRGGGMEALWNPVGEPVGTGVLIRDALIDAFRAAGALRVPEMGRIRTAGGGAR
jgi:2',3'-cyclic-nucleotide 2'-phosphodiesterase (5'-nucleotidase family)